MLNSHCNKNGKKKNYAITEIWTQEVYMLKMHQGVHYAMEADGINR